MLRKLVALVLSFAIVSALIPPTPARADMKKTGTVLAVVGLGLVGAGVVMYLTRGEEPAEPITGFNFHIKKSMTPALVVGGSGLAMASIGVSLIKKADKKAQGVSLQLEPRPGAIALAARF
ncbi:MAG: hypothetical protein AAB011_05665 [Candidatus Eisenbacteria bacterium]